MVCNNDYYYYYLILELKFVNFDCFYNITLCVKYMIDLFSLIKQACIKCIHCFLFIFLNYFSHIKLYRSGKIMHSQWLQSYGHQRRSRPIWQIIAFSAIFTYYNYLKLYFSQKYLHPCYVFGIASTDWKTMVTISNTPILRVWDITKKVTDKNKIKATGAVRGLVRM